ncbi:MAG: PD-(D/E)XK nuclease family protein, partial [Gemmatimonadales bacterium]|nr:PD-(D/E)XK nuclease family protein [Gemmatimonadales bacterium]
LGSLLHVARMHYYRGQAGLPALDPVEAMRQAPGRIAWVFDRARRIWEGYAKWAPVADRFKVLSVEEEYEIRIGGNLFTARLDLVYQGTDGRVWIDDLKSTGGNVEKHHYEWDHAGQMAMIDVLGRAVLPAVFGVPYGGITITSICTASTFAAARAPLQIAPAWRASVLEAAREGLAAIANDPRAAWDLPPNPEACMDRWGPCDYRDLCTRGPTEAALAEFDQAAVETLVEGAGR